MTATNRPGLDEIGREVENILVRAAGVDRAALGRPEVDSLADLGMDSLAAMELQAVVKSQYEVQLPDELLERSVPEIAAMIDAALPRGR
jgi:acyl carrier protein